MSELRFDGKAAIVTGAGSGLGRVYALALAARGARVLVNCTGVVHKEEDIDTEAADSVVQEICNAGGVACANYDSVDYGKEIVRSAISAFGRVDILINSAGLRRDARFGKMTTNDWNMVVKTSLNGTFSVTKHVWDYMRAQRYGRIVNMGSWAGLYGDVRQTNYAAANMAIVGLSRGLSREGAAYGIKVNTVIPLASSRLSHHPVDSSDEFALFPPEKVAPIVLFLCHQSCNDSGLTIEAGGGVADAVQWQRAKGAFFPGPFSPEELAGKWREVQDFTNGETATDAKIEAAKVNRRRQRLCMR